MSSKLARHTAQHPTKRPIEKGHMDTAKAQAYILRDLLSEHCSVKLTGTDVTDAFAFLYHGSSWVSLSHNQRMFSDGHEYYATKHSDPLIMQTKYLKKLIPTLKGNVGAALASMPQEAYEEARTLTGAHIASLLAGELCWRLTQGVVFDAETDQECMALCFNSDPKTNEERLRVRRSLDGMVVDLQLDRIRFVKYGRDDARVAVPGQEYYLSGHAYPETKAKSFYRSAVDYPVAARWFNNGGEVRVFLVTSGGERATPQLLGDWMQEGERDFTKTMANLRRAHSGANVILVPLGLNKVRDPAEKYNPSYKHLRAFLPAVSWALQASIDLVRDQLDAGTPERTGDAIELYNTYLLQALECLYRDTLGTNSRETLRGYLDKGESGTYFGYLPFKQLCEFASIAPDEVAKISDEEAAALMEQAQKECPVGF